LLPFAAISLCYFGFAGLFGTYAPLWYQSLGYSTFAIGVAGLAAERDPVFAPYCLGLVGRSTPAGRERCCASPSAGRWCRRSGFFLFPRLRLDRRRHASS
jgi:hypothetical protein